jgi:hypothetical protein
MIQINLKYNNNILCSTKEELPTIPRIDEYIVLENIAYKVNSVIWIASLVNEAGELFK